MVFQPACGLNNEYEGNFKGGVPLLLEVWRVHSPIAPHAVESEIVGVAGANMQWGHFVCHSYSQ